MATISGRIIFDRDRSVTINSGDSGIANIPVVLQNINTTERLTVLTDSNGNYAFLNVPAGSYRIVESYGTTGGSLHRVTLRLRYREVSRRGSIRPSLR